MSKTERISLVMEIIEQAQEQIDNAKFILESAVMLLKDGVENGEI